MVQRNMEIPNEIKADPRKVAKKFEAEIKTIVANRFKVEAGKLSLLLNDEQGAYYSEQEPNTLCSFVVGNQNGYMYLVTAEFDADSQSLRDFKSDIIS